MTCQLLLCLKREASQCYPTFVFNHLQTLFEVDSAKVKRKPCGKLPSSLRQLPVGASCGSRQGPPVAEDRVRRQPLQVLVERHLAHLHKVLLLHHLR